MFTQKIDFDTSCKLSPLLRGDNLQEVSKSASGKNKKNITKSADSAHTVVKVNHI